MLFCTVFLCIIIIADWGQSQPSTGMGPPSTQSRDTPRLFARLHWLGHSCFRLDGPAIIYFDPGVSLADAAPKADIILISHSHSDHIFMPSVKRILKPETVILSTALVKDIAKEYGIAEHFRAVRPGETVQLGTVQVEATPAYNIDKSWHRKESQNLGFIVTVQGERIYHAGDTDRIPEMAQIRCDVALLPIGGTYTMNIQEAALAAADIKPKVVVPMHTWNTDDYEEFQKACGCNVVLLKKE